MKEIMILGLLFCLTFSPLLGQQIKLTEEIECKEIRGEASLNAFINEDFWISKYTMIINGSKTKHDYQVVDLNNNTYSESPSIQMSEDGYQGIILNHHVKGDYIYELVQFDKKSMAFDTGKFKVGVQKRSIKSFELEGEVKFFDDPLTKNFFMRIDDGYLDLSSNSESGEVFLVKYDFETNLLWKKPLDIPLGLTLSGLQNFENNSDKKHLLLTLTDFNKRITEASFAFQTSFMQIVIDAEEEVSNTNLKFENNIIFDSYKFYFDTLTNHFSGFFLSNIQKGKSYPPIYDQGYCLYEWDDTGAIVKLNEQLLTSGDIIDNETKEFLSKESKKMPLPDDATFPSLKNPNIVMFKKDDGNFIICFDRLANFGRVNYEQLLINCCLVFEIDFNGKIVWHKTIVRKELPKSFFTSVCERKEFFSFDSNKLTTYIIDDSKLSIVSINCDDGSVIKNEAMETFNIDLSPKGIYQLENDLTSIIVRHLSADKKRIQFSKIAL